MIKTETTTALLSSILDTAYSEITNSKIRPGLYDLVYRLKRVADTNDQEDFKEWIQQFCQDHPVNELLQQDPYTNRSLRKPRGYSGDAELIDYFYRLNGPDTSTSYLGRELFAASMECSACDSVRWRANHIAETIDQLHSQKGHKLDVLSVASGHLRELHQITDFDMKINSFVALDQDATSNRLVRQTFDYQNLTVLDESLKYIITGQLADSKFDFVYSSGLYDYLDNKLATRLTTLLFDTVKPGGTLLIANFCPGLHERGYMEAFMDWYLIYRDEAQFISLLRGINHQLNSDCIRTYRDDYCNVVYMAITKKK